MIIIKSLAEIEQMAHAGKLARQILDSLIQRIQPGIATRELDQLAYRITKENGARPAFLGYRGYPYCICTSVNDQVVHGFPGEYVLKEGDIIAVDLGVEYGGYYGDVAATVPVGEVSSLSQRLIETTQEALKNAINQMRPGRSLSDISATIQEVVEEEGFSVVRAFVGHGIGQSLHEDPQIPNYGSPGHGPILEEGMVFALEPMVNAGSWEVKILPDKWTAVTADGSLSAHFEHTVAVTKDGPMVLTE